MRSCHWTTAAQWGMIASMAFWDDVPTGRWVVEEVSWVVSTGQRTLQKALNEGESHGYELRAVVPTKDELLVIWEKPGKYE
jgi:hypothetical protein